MTSAPRSASSWVPNGPAPNCETLTIRRPSSIGRSTAPALPVRLEGVLPERGVVLLGNEGGAREGHDLLAALVADARLDAHRAAVTLPRLPLGRDRRLRVEGVADEGRRLVDDPLDLEVG